MKTLRVQLAGIQSKPVLKGFLGFRGVGFRIYDFFVWILCSGAVRNPTSEGQTSPSPKG